MIREVSDAWVDVLASPYWLTDGSFLWQSNRSGYRHLYHYSAAGELLDAVTEGEWEVRELEAVDESKGLVYFSSAAESRLENHLFSVALDGGEVDRISREGGNHKVTFNDEATLYLDEWSDLRSPTQVRLHEAQGRLIRKIAENRVEVLDEYQWGETEFLQVEADDGFVLQGLMIKPTSFDRSKKYPVLIYTYGGPHSSAMTSQKVWNRWGGRNYLWHQMLAQRGYVVWICDPRTSSGKGVQSAWPAYRNLGSVELADLEEMVDWLKGQPFVDGDRIGLWGWSYGGFLTSYALTHSDSFRMGIAGAPVTDWRLYDTIYTERYMGLPSENREGYRQSSVLKAAGDLSGKLLLIHGGVDDNVHLQNTLQLADRLQKAGKQFELMIYPRSRHSVRDPSRLKHLRRLMTDFILRNL